MNRVIAAIDDSVAGRPVLTMALAVAPVLGAQVECVHVGPGGEAACAEAVALDVRVSQIAGDPLSEITARAADDDVVAIAVGARDRTGGRRRVGHFALLLADAVDKPVLLVPPEVIAPARLHRVVAAVKGTHDRARPLRRAVAIIGRSELDLVVVHVQDEASIPAFTDQPQYEAAAYADEFLARHVPGAPQARAQLRFGDPVEQLLAAAREERAELLAVGWTQGDPERGVVARTLAEHSPVPLLLVPLAAT